jgi:DNA adenine methylase
MITDTAPALQAIRYVSPLRYPGGKSSLAKFVQTILVENNLAKGAYAEPYAGGASIGLSLLLGGHITRLYINDADPAVFAFWQAITKENSHFCELVDATAITVDEWDRQRHIYENPSKVPFLTLGFATFFLNRTNRSGIIQSGGIIGGREQHGRLRIDARFNRRELITRLKRIGRLKNSIAVSNEDALVFLQRSRRELPLDTFLYLDPPYYVKGASRLYANYYQHEDHSKIARVVTKMQHKWIVSYDRATAIRALYADHFALVYSLRYSASRTLRGNEYMFFSTGLTIPRLNRPINATIRAPTQQARQRADRLTTPESDKGRRSQQR